MSFVYYLTGKDNNGRPTKGLAHRVVISLVQDLEGKGYHVYTDNFYSSPALFMELKSKGFEACGTVRKNCRGLSTTFQAMNLDKGKECHIIVHLR